MNTNDHSGFDPSREERLDAKFGTDPDQQKRSFDSFMGRLDELKVQLKNDIQRAHRILHAAPGAVDTYVAKDKDFGDGQRIANTTIHTFFIMLWADSGKTDNSFQRTFEKLKQIKGGWRFDLSPEHWMEVYIEN